MLALLALLAATGGQAGQVESTRLHAVLGEATANVRVDIRAVVPEGPGRTTLSFIALEVGDSQIAGVEAWLSDTPLAVEVDSSRRPILEGTVVLPESRSSEVELAFRYTVTGPRSVVPVLRLELPPGPSRPETFFAEVETPEGVVFEPGFPSHETRGENGSYVWQLPTVPAFLSFGPPAEVTWHPVSLFEAGFALWGLFAVFASVVALYAIWMVRAES